ncbi:hypothetical protein MMAN_28470 [Mycobacterium mantenii]|uniref:Acyl-CoA thioesterase n=1 Tax=Mycobacterium mantenii TaxID=560555 RepID=A0A1X0FHW8_MYCNT|nr:DUF427 domain-containing protein [Mycobacterium mantenii]MCV7245431.1 DUF427 domain-containing protein [Mycobacterium mantenii]ORB01422.1 acyl-CoA thioesterase [Mycobacterium mantenii]BBY38713.1 hypothetical protein MMAN_28470 [Mycobacterium mantenii]
MTRSEDPAHEVESAWPDHPDYRIDITPCQHTGQVWHGDTLIAEGDGCLVVTETDHVDRLYFPESDVRWDLLTPSDRTTECPFKGRATYWDLAGAPDNSEGVAWTYRTPLPEVAGLAGYVAFYDKHFRIEVVERWPDGRGVPASFPVWGDAAELLRVIDVEPVGEGRFVGPAHGPTWRNVVEGGQLIAESIVAVSKTLARQRVTSVSAIFTKSAAFDAPVDLAVDVLRLGRTFSTTQVHATQHGALCCAAIVLADSGAPDLIRDQPPMPDVPGPDAAEAFTGFGVTGREIRIVNGAYDPDPDRIGPPIIDVWVRFRDAPDASYLHAALLAQSTTHWTIAAGLSPHRGFGEAQAHDTVSTGVMKSTIAFHDDVDVSDWLLYSNDAFWSGRGLIQGDGRVFTLDGRLAASYTVQAMARAFDRTPAAMGRDNRTAM